MLYKVNDEIVLREIGGFFFLINPKLSYNSDAEDIFQTNEVGALIWNCIEDGDNIMRITQKVFLAIDDEKTPALVSAITEDVCEFMSVLCRQGFVQEIG
jgi:hypothetical protein